MPIAAFISSSEVMSDIAYKPALGHITTFGGHPVTAAAAGTDNLTTNSQTTATSKGHTQAGKPSTVVAAIAATIRLPRTPDIQNFLSSPIYWRILLARTVPCRHLRMRRLSAAKERFLRRRQGLQDRNRQAAPPSGGRGLVMFRLPRGSPRAQARTLRRSQLAWAGHHT